MKLPWTSPKSSGSNDEAVQEGQDGVATLCDGDAGDEHFESDWEDLRQPRLTEDQIWESRPTESFNGLHHPYQGSAYSGYFTDYSVELRQSFPLVTTERS